MAEVSGKPVLQNRQVFFARSEDMTRLTAENERLRATVAELEELNKHDPLTGLLNKNAYTMYLNSEYGKVKLGEQQSIGLVRFDLDNFSWVNDVLGGHHFGDMYLSVTGDLLRKHIRTSYDTAFRIGGDEFSLLMGGDVTMPAFEDALRRLHDGVNGKSLRQTLDVLGRSHRLIKMPGDRVEREGTVAMKELLSGITDLLHNTDGVRDHFLAHGRGSQSQKEFLLSTLEGKDFSEFDAYRHDTRTDHELTPAEKTDRIRTEMKLGEIIAELFPKLTVSMAGVLITAGTEIDPLAADKKADMMVGSIKRRGGSGIVVGSV